MNDLSEQCKETRQKRVKTEAEGQVGVSGSRNSFGCL